MPQVEVSSDRYNSSGKLPHKQNKEEHTNAITAANLPQRLMVLKWWCGGRAAAPSLGLHRLLLSDPFPDSPYHTTPHHTSHPHHTFAYNDTYNKGNKWCVQITLHKVFFSLIVSHVEVMMC